MVGGFDVAAGRYNVTLTDGQLLKLRPGNVRPTKSPAPAPLSIVAPVADTSARRRLKAAVRTVCAAHTMRKGAGMRGISFGLGGDSTALPRSPIVTAKLPLDFRFGVQPAARTAPAAAPKHVPADSVGHAQAVAVASRVSAESDTAAPTDGEARPRI